MIFNYLGLGVKLRYHLLLPTVLGRNAPARIPLWWAGALSIAQMGALWRWAPQSPMRPGG